MMPRRANGLHKPEVILAGVFANGLLSTVEQRLAVRMVGDEVIDLDDVDFTNVNLVIIFGYGHRIAERQRLRFSAIIWPDPSSRRPAAMTARWSRSSHIRCRRRC